MGLKVGGEMECIYRERGVRSGGYIAVCDPLGTVLQFESARQLYDCFAGGWQFPDMSPAAYSVFGGEAGSEKHMNAEDFLAEYKAGLEAKSLDATLEKGFEAPKRTGL